MTLRIQEYVVNDNTNLAIISEYTSVSDGTAIQIQVSKCEPWLSEVDLRYTEVLLDIKTYHAEIFL